MAEENTKGPADVALQLLAVCGVAVSVGIGTCAIWTRSIDASVFGALLIVLGGVIGIGTLIYIALRTRRRTE